jgi:AraC family transcriptional regulator
MGRTSAGLPGVTLRRVVEHITANVHRAPPLAELSALAHMSVFHFARLFKLSTGLPPHRFVVRQRIEHAKVLLARGDVSIAEVARGVGFRTASHFTSAFQRATGLTPSAYRARSASVLADSC